MTWGVNEDPTDPAKKNPTREHHYKCINFGPGETKDIMHICKQQDMKMIKQLKPKGYASWNSDIKQIENCIFRENKNKIKEEMRTAHNTRAKM